MQGNLQRLGIVRKQVWVRLGQGERSENLLMQEVSETEWELSLQKPPGFYWYKPYVVINGREIWEGPPFQNHWVCVDPSGFKRVFVAYVREFGKSSKQRGTFGDITRYLAEIDPQGTRFDTIQLLPMFPVDKDTGGNPQSPFAPLDYFMIEPGLAGVETVSIEELRQIARLPQEERSPPADRLADYIRYETDRRFKRDPSLSKSQWKTKIRLEQEVALARFREFIQRQKASGRKVMLDIPAHAGRESLISAIHPDWLIHDRNGDAVTPGAGGVRWKDLMMFDFQNPEVRRYFREVFRYWINAGVEGFRLDWAHGLPLDFVKELREEFPEVYFLAEQLSEKETQAGEQLMRQGGMNAVYNSEWLMAWDVMGALARIHKGDPFMTELSIRDTHDSRRMQQGWNGDLSPEVFEGILAAQILGMPDPIGILYGSMEMARQKPQLVGIHPIFEDEKGTLSLEARDRLLALLDLRAREPLFGDRGNWSPSGVTVTKGEPSGVIAFFRRSQEKEFLVMISLSGQEKEISWPDPRTTLREKILPGRVIVKEFDLELKPQSNSVSENNL